MLHLMDGPSEIVPQSGQPLGYSSGSSKANNLSPCGHPRDLWLHGNVRDPEKRYALGLDFSSSQRVAFCKELPDFINDPNWQEKIVDSDFIKYSRFNVLEFWDEIHQEWVNMRQAPNHAPVRCGGRYASSDLKNWTLEHYLYPDAHDSTDPRYYDEVYGIMGIHIEGMVLGFAFWFHAGAPGIGRETESRRKSNNGPQDVRIVVSRDGGCTWDRTVSREAWIPHGTEHDSYDRYVRLDCPPLLR